MNNWCFANGLELNITKCDNLLFVESRIFLNIWDHIWDPYCKKSEYNYLGQWRGWLWLHSESRRRLMRSSFLNETFFLSHQICRHNAYCRYIVPMLSYAPKEEKVNFKLIENVQSAATKSIVKPSKSKNIDCLTKFAVFPLPIYLEMHLQKYFLPFETFCSYTCIYHQFF